MNVAGMLPDHTVVVADGRITAVAPSSLIDTSNMRVIDGTGKCLLPGLADMHAHFNDPSYARLFLANGITTIRNMAGAPGHLAWEQRVQKGEVAGPHIVSASRIIDGPRFNGKPALPVSRVLIEPANAFALVGGYVERGYSEIKVQHLLSTDAFRAVCDAADHFGVRVSGHCPQQLSFEEAADIGMDCFEHLQFLSNGHMRADAGERPLAKEGALAWLADNLDLDAIAVLARRMRDQGVWNCPTLKSRQGRHRAAQITTLSAPFLRYLPRLTLNLWSYGFTNVTRDSNSTEELSKAMKRWNDRQKDFVRILYEEGAPLLIGTDSDNFFTMPGFSLHEELENFVDAGCSTWDAISFATSKAAEYVGQGAEWGTVAEGFRADLILVSGNPLADISVLQQPAAVAVNGFWLDADDITGMLQQSAAEVPMDPQMPPRPGVRDGWEVEEAGELVESFGNVRRGCCSYVHAVNPQGGHWVAENRADSAGISERRTELELELSKTLQIKNGRIRVSSEYGVETHLISIDEKGCRVESTDFDGAVSINTFGPGVLLLPTERLAPSLAGRLASHTPKPGRLALDYPPGLAQVSAEPHTDGGYTLSVDRETQLTKMEVQVAPSTGTVIQVKEETFWGKRIVVPNHPAENPKGNNPDATVDAN